MKKTLALNPRINCGNELKPALACRLVAELVVLGSSVFCFYSVESADTPEFPPPELTGPQGGLL